MVEQEINKNIYSVSKIFLSRTDVRNIEEEILPPWLELLKKLNNINGRLKKMFLLFFELLEICGKSGYIFNIKSTEQRRI